MIVTLTVTVSITRYVIVIVPMTIAGWQQYLDTAVSSWASRQCTTFDSAIDRCPRNAETPGGLADRHPLANRDVVMTVMLTVTMMVSMTVRHDVVGLSG
jgi:hypothetical protein